jgi:hemoglobin
VNPELIGRAIFRSGSGSSMGGRAMKRILIALMFGLILQPAASRAADPTLYQRLGGYDAIAAVTDDFLGRLARDPSLGRFFVGHGTDSIHRIRQDIVNFLCKATGGPCLYTARDLKTAHAGLGITGADWDKSLVSPQSHPRQT